MDNHQENAENVGDDEEIQIEAPPTSPTSAPEVHSVNPNPNVLSGGNAENEKHEEVIKNSIPGVTQKFKRSASEGAQVATNISHQVGIHTSIGEVKQLSHSNANMASNPNVCPLNPDAIDPNIPEVLRPFNPGNGSRLSSKNIKHKKIPKTIYLRELVRPSNADTGSGSSSTNVKQTVSNKTTIAEVVPTLNPSLESGSNPENRKQSITTSMPDVVCPLNPSTGSTGSNYSENAELLKIIKTSVKEVVDQMMNPGTGSAESNSENMKHSVLTSIKTSIMEIDEPRNSGTGSAGSNSHENVKCKETSIKTSLPEVVRAPLNPGTGSGSNADKLMNPESIKTSTSEVLVPPFIAAGSGSGCNSDKVKLLSGNIKTTIAEVVTTLNTSLESGSNPENVKQSITASMPEVVRPLIPNTRSAGSLSDNVELMKIIKTSIMKEVAHQMINPGTGSAESNSENVKCSELTSIKTGMQEIVEPLNPGTGSAGSNSQENVKRQETSIKTSLPEVVQVPLNPGTGSGSNSEKQMSPESIKTSTSEVLALPFVPSSGSGSNSEVLPTLSSGTESGLNAENAKQSSCITTTVPKFWSPNVASGLNADEKNRKQTDSTKISIPEVPPFVNPGAGAELNGENGKDDPKSMNTSVPEVVQFNIPGSGSGLSTQNAMCINTSFPEVRAPFNPGQGSSGLVNVQNVNENNSKPCIGSSSNQIASSSYEIGSSSNSNRQEQEDKAPAELEVDEPILIENMADVLGPERTRFYLFQGSENEHMARNFIDQMDFKINIDRNVQLFIRPGPARAPAAAPAAAPAPAPAVLAPEPARAPAPRLDTEVCCLFCRRNVTSDGRPFQRRLCGHYFHLHCFHAQPLPVKESHIWNPLCNFCTLPR